MTNRLLFAHQVISSAYDEFEGNLTKPMDDLWNKIVDAFEPQSDEESRALLCLLRDAVDSAIGFEVTRIASRWAREKFHTLSE